MSSKTRKHEIEIKVEATPEQVWDAVTTGDGLMSWFAPDAGVVPGEGGSIRFSWGAGMEATAPIRIWDPVKRVGWVEGEGSEHPKLVEFVIEAAEGGSTILRLVHSGFGEGANFDNEFESVYGGWHTFLATLRYRLDRFAGVPATNATEFRMIAMPQAEAWPAVCKLMSLTSTAEGARYEGVIGGIPLNGAVLRTPKPGYLCLSVESFGDSVLGVFVEGSKKAFVTLQWIHFGDSGSERGAEAQQAIARLLDGLVAQAPQNL